MCVLADVGLPHTLAETDGVDETLLRRLVPLAAADPSMGGNPKPLTNAEIESVFVKALKGDLS